jgi:Patatin-like phospholipase
MSAASGPRPGVAFVLSGGASLGAIQVGMLHALADHGVRPNVIVGTSVGAVNGAFLACRDFTADTVDQLAELWCGIRREHVFPLRRLTGLLGFLGTRKNLVPAGALRHRRPLCAERGAARRARDGRAGDEPHGRPSLRRRGRRVRRPREVDDPAAALPDRDPADGLRARRRADQPSVRMRALSSNEREARVVPLPRRAIVARP